jgi:predicted ester cyclase
MTLEPISFKSFSSYKPSSRRQVLILKTGSIYFFLIFYAIQKNKAMKQLFAFIFIVALSISCNNATQPVVTNPVDSVAMAKEAMLQKNKAAALGFIQAINSKNMNDMVRDFATDYIDYHDGSIPPTKGLDSLKSDIALFVAAFPDVKADNLVAVAEGNQVAVFGEWSGTFKADMGKMKATGKSFKLKDADLFTFNDAGKIIEHRSVQPGEALMSQVMNKKSK